MTKASNHFLQLKYLGINTYHEAIIYMREDYHVCRANRFEVHHRIQNLQFFAQETYPILLEPGITNLVTCNTITHETNAIDVSDLLIDSLRKI